MSLVYFAEPIDQDRHDDLEAKFRATLVDLMATMGHTVFRPATAWSVGKLDRASSTGVEGINRDALNRADLLVARLPLGAASVGVPMEIEHATRTMGIPAIVVGTGGVALLANPNVHLVSEDFVEFRDLFNTLADRKPRQKPIYHVGPLKPRSYAGDAGIDLVASETTVVPAGGTAKVPTGNRFQFPTGVWGWIVSRSSTFANWGLVVLPGIIDEEYTGELFASVFNPSDKPVLVNKGDRVCQIILFDNVTARFQPVQVDEIEDRDRGSNGFGSTGSGIETVTAG